MNKKSLTFFSGLKGYVIFLVVAGFVASSSIAYFAFQRISGKIVEEIGIHFSHKQILLDRTRSLQPLLREIALAKKLARSFTIKEWAEDENNPRLKKRGINELESFRDMFRDGSYFFVVDRSGNYYFNDRDGNFTADEYRYTLNPDNPKDMWYYATLLIKNECQLNVDRDRELNRTKVWINCVVKRDSKMLGIVGTGIDLTEFIQDAVNSKQLGVNTLFIDQSGAIQAHRNLEMIDFRSLTKRIQDKKTIFQLIKNPIEKKEFQLLLDSLKNRDVDVKSIFLHIDGKRYLTGASFLEEIGWFNVTMMDLEVMVDRSFFHNFAGLIAGALFITLLLVIVLFNRFVINRIYRLENSMQQVLKGDFDAITLDQRDDEIGRLSSTFKEMAETIDNHTKNLEQRVQSRTKELEAAKERAEEATKLKDKFVSLVAHDLRGPIGTVSGLLELSLSKTITEDEKREHTEMSIKSLDRLTEMIQKLLEIGRLQAGTIMLKKDLCDARLLVLKTIFNLGHTANDKDIEIVNDVPEGVELLVDQMLTETVLTNLLDNAIKFTPKGGTVTFFMPTKDIISVKNSGEEIPAKKLPNLFKHDVKTTSIGTAGETGTGLGLPLCYDIIKAHDGNLSVERSASETIFHIKIPSKRLTK